MATTKTATVEWNGLDAFDRRYRTINQRAYINAEEFIGIPQNPRRLTVGFALRMP